MAIPNKVTKKVPLDLRGMTTSQKNELKDRAGQLYVDLISKDVDDTKSPVTGRGFVKLSKEYAALKKSKGKGSSPNLQLSQKMMDTLRYKKYRDGIEVGIFASQQAKKADNHNKFSSESKGTAVPRRPFIPREDENFRPDLKKQLIKMTKEFRKELGLRVNK